ncbi:MAG: RDD family protein [Marinilabiliaceae bacterium]|nr:RDD family protein [Marinilabiliaceae bacterium]
MSTATPESFLQAPLTERILAAIVDIAIVCGLSLFPRIGWIFGLFYFLLRDSLFFKGQSLGKKLMRIKVITLPENEPLSNYPEKSALRAIVALIPGLNLVDLWFLITVGYRLADKWAQTAVIPFSESESDNF